MCNFFKIKEKLKDLLTLSIFIPFIATAKFI